TWALAWKDAIDQQNRNRYARAYTYSENNQGLIGHLDGVERPPRACNSPASPSRRPMQRPASSSGSGRWPDGPTDAPEATEFSETTRLVVAPTSGLIDDPINAANGNMIHPEHDLAFPAIAASLNVSRTWAAATSTAKECPAPDRSSSAPSPEAPSRAAAER
ncbi:MAG: DUF6531 domain-containing protein, partial [Ilumatobacter sp.]|uniref:DUF6531 domain-containing protein n=1 Tax=Ilumatobacter sp. TaxID=1967498 RepID=UPI003C7656FC